MNTKKLTSIFLFLLASQMLFASLEITTVTLTDESNIMNSVEDQNYISETDLNRVETRVDAYENGDFENWDDPHQPSGLTTSRSSMIDIDLEYSIVSEGARSVRLMAMGTDINHPASAPLYLQSWSNPVNPANLTVSFDYYIDLLRNPQLGDRLELVLPLGSRYVHYYIGSDTNPSNTSTHNYIELSAGPLQTWNTFERNVTQDHIEAFGITPSDLGQFTFYVHSYEFELARAYIDDVTFVNGTNIIVGDLINGGNFETGFSGTWWYTWSYDSSPGDISQSSTRIEGDWSLNMTALSYGTTGDSSVIDTVNRKLTSINKDEFSFSWNLADWQVSTPNSRAYTVLQIKNMTSEFYVYYLIGFGGASPIIGNPEDIVILVDDFNITGTWNAFNRCVFDDVNVRYPGSNIEVAEIAFNVEANTDGSRVTLLLDAVSFVTSIIHDEGYEDQGDVGYPIYGWDTNFGTHPAHTVTDFSANGNKAANITLFDDEDIEIYQQLAADLQLSESTELILDLNWYIETLNESSNDYLVLKLNLDSNTITLPIMNSSSIDLEDWDYGTEDAFVVQPETNNVGQWVNWQIDLVHLFEDVFGELPETTIYGIEIIGYADHPSSLTVFMDDLYIYYDSAPEIEQISQNPALVDEAGDLVEITAEVIDASEVVATLSYRTNSGSWTNITMDETIAGNHTVELNAPYGLTEYFVTAKDAFGKTDIAMDGEDYFVIAAVDSIDPAITLTPANGSTVSGLAFIEIQVTDRGSGIANAELYIEGALLVNLTQDLETIAWDTSESPNGEYNITVVAEDNAGNTASVTHFLTVENAGDSSADFTGVILIVVVIAIIGAVAVIYIFVLKKR